MEGTRNWQRGNSKNARGNSNSRQLTQPADQSDIDPLMSTIQKSHIASILQGARSHVGGGAQGKADLVSRPFTPGDIPRHLFQGDDYANRPGSSYKVKGILGQAAEEFNSAVGNQSFTTNATTYTSGSTKIGMGSAIRSGSQNKDQNIINVLQKHDISKKPRGNQLPALVPIQKDSLKNIAGALNNRQQNKGFDSSKPIKAQQQIQSQDSSGSMQATGSQIAPAKKIIKLKKPSAGAAPQQQQQSVDDFSDLIGGSVQDKDMRMDVSLKYDESKMNNMMKIQELQKEIKQANRQRSKQAAASGQNEQDNDGMDEEEKDEYEDYFENQMLMDMEGVESYEQKIDYYAESLNQIKQKVKDIDQQQNVDDEDQDDYMSQSLMQQEEEMGGYTGEYQEVIHEMSRLCSIITHNNKTDNKDKKITINEDDIMELCPRIYTLVTEHDKQIKSIQQQCFLETLLKGSFSLLAVKHPRGVIRLSACIIHTFLKIFDKYANPDQQYGTQADFAKIYNYLFETMKILLIYAKEGQHDLLFKQENLIPQLARVIHQCFLEKSDMIIKLTTQVVYNKEIINEDLVYDLVNYSIGTIKCFTQSNTEVQLESITTGRYILLFSRCLQKAMNFGTNMSKKAQMLVQICGALRNLSNDEQHSYKQICSNGIIPKLIEILDKFKGHKELMLNVSRILSKTSMDNECSQIIINTQKLPQLIDLIFDFQTFTSFVIRIAFVLANITTYFEEAREQLGSYKKGFEKILQMTLSYFAKDESGSGSQNKEVLSNGVNNNEDCLVKLIRLIANVCTDETFTLELLVQNQGLLAQFVDNLVQSLQKKNLEQSEEFIFNATSCCTNILFYDTPQHQLLPLNSRVKLFQTFKSFILITTHEELQIESVRVLSNLSRHQDLCLEFVSDKTFLEAICVVLDHTLRDLVFYAIGIVINITLHEETRGKVLEKGVIAKLVEVLKDANIEDMELAKVSAKALHNIANENQYWQIDQIKKLDEILTNLGEELDSIMDVANEEELEEIKGLRDMVNALINDMPEPMFGCPDQSCGRKFKVKAELDKHIERRHGKKPQ